MSCIFRKNCSEDAFYGEDSYQEHPNPGKKGDYHPDAGLNASFATLKEFVLLQTVFSEAVGKGTCCRAGSMPDRASPRGCRHHALLSSQGLQPLLSH